MIEVPAKSVDEALKDEKRIERAFRRAFRNAVLEHRRDGFPMIFWENGRIVHVPADQVSLPEVEE